MDIRNGYTELHFPANRDLYIHGLELAYRKHNLVILIDLDITLARKAIRQYRNKTGSKLLFIAWLVKCIGQAVSEHSNVCAMRKRKKLIIFNDVDIMVNIIREMNGDKAIIPYIVRKADSKPLQDINDEIETAKSHPVPDINENEIGVKYIKMYLSLPRFMRKCFMKKILSDPVSAKEKMGMVLVTSTGDAIKMKGSMWGITAGPQPLSFIIGNVVKKPGVIKGNIEVREYLNMTVIFDHDIVDGVPAVRFVSRLVKLAENAYGLANADQAICDLTLEKADIL